MKNVRDKHAKKLKEAFVNRHDKAVTTLKKHHQNTLDYVQKKNAQLGEAGNHAVRLLASGALSGAMLLSAPTSTDFLPPASVGQSLKDIKKKIGDDDPDEVLPDSKIAAQAAETLGDRTDTNSGQKATISKEQLGRLLREQLPSQPQSLTQKQEAEVARVLSQNLHVKASAELEGYRLNTSYGRIGYEQHLPRFPGDTVALHDQYQEDGITGGTGAWGYFVDSREELTPEVEQMEKYYFAVQTFVAPGWKENIYDTKEWFKHRKMIVVNPKTGDAVVGVVADAGPAVWTGKQFGGSPEIMHELNLQYGMRNGEVILFFVEDPNNEIPLGPIQMGQ